MSETRRQIFKVSVLSAFGLMACSPSIMKPTVVGSGSTDPQNAGLLVNTNIGWIYLDPVISFAFGVTSYTAYNVATLPAPQPPVHPGSSNIAAYDLAKIATALSDKNKVTPAQTVTVNGPGNPTFSIDGNSSVTTSAVGTIVNVGQFTWNEIGSNVVAGNF